MIITIFQIKNIAMQFGKTIEYLLIENTDTDYIKIVPVETVRNPVDGVEDHGGETSRTRWIRW